jgi:hypothetical protein
VSVGSRTGDYPRALVDASRKELKMKTEINVLEMVIEKKRELDRKENERMKGVLNAAQILYWHLKCLNGLPTKNGWSINIYEEKGNSRSNIRIRDGGNNLCTISCIGHDQYRLHNNDVCSLSKLIDDVTNLVANAVTSNILNGVLNQL